MIPKRPDHPTDEELRKMWAKTRGFLEIAKRALRAQNTRDYEEYLAHNELECAMQVLAYCAENESQSPEFWKAMADAAENMKLENRASRFRAMLRGCLQDEGG